MKALTARDGALRWAYTVRVRHNHRSFVAIRLIKLLIGWGTLSEILVEKLKRHEIGHRHQLKHAVLYIQTSSFYKYHGSIHDFG